MLEFPRISLKFVSRPAKLQSLNRELPGNSWAWATAPSGLPACRTEPGRREGSGSCANDRTRHGHRKSAPLTSPWRAYSLRSLGKVFLPGLSNVVVVLVGQVAGVLVSKLSLGFTSPLLMSSDRPSGMGAALMNSLLCLLGDLERHMIWDSSDTVSLE